MALTKGAHGKVPTKKEDDSGAQPHVHIWRLTLHPSANVLEVEEHGEAASGLLNKPGMAPRRVLSLGAQHEQFRPTCSA